MATLPYRAYLPIYFSKVLPIHWGTLRPIQYPSYLLYDVRISWDIIVFDAPYINSDRDARLIHVVYKLGKIKE